MNNNNVNILLKQYGSLSTDVPCQQKEWAVENLNSTFSLHTIWILRVSNGGITWQGYGKCVSGDKNNFESFPFQLISFIRLKRFKVHLPNVACVHSILSLCWQGSKIFNEPAVKTLNVDWNGRIARSSLSRRSWKLGNCVFPPVTNTF